jgi:hypothetical protein
MSFTTVPNPDCEVKKIGMTCDKRPADLNPRIPWNAGIYLIAPPGGGKTNLIMNLISRRKQFYWRKFDRIVFFSPSLHTIKKKIGIPEEDLIDGFDLDKLREVIDEQKGSDEHTLIILDDCIVHLKKNMGELLETLFNRRHMGSGCSVIITSQKYSKTLLRAADGDECDLHLRSEQKRDGYCI